MLKDVDEIWRSIRRPIEFRDSWVTDFFELRIHGLPNKRTQYMDFSHAVRNLKQDWMKTAKPYSRGVPADGFPFYLKVAFIVWLTMSSNT